PQILLQKISTAVNHKPLNGPRCLVLLQKITQLRVAVYRKLRVEHSKLIDYVLRPRLLQILKQLEPALRRLGIAKNRSVIRKVVHIRRDTCQWLGAQIS